MTDSLHGAGILEASLRARRSVRGFRRDPVPAEDIRSIFRLAAQSPSNCNIQPWIVHVLSGNAADRLRIRLHDAARNGTPPSPDYPFPDAYPGVYRDRQIEAAKALFAATGVERNDGSARTQSFLRNYRFFDAPHVAFILMPAWAGVREAADCGMYTQTLMLAMADHGVASCAQGALGHYAGIVRAQLGVQDDLRVLFGIAFGHEDYEHPANRTRTDRAALEDTTYFHD